MIQRIQSIYLLAATALTSCLYYFKLVSYASESASYAMFFNGIFNTENLNGESLINTMAFTILLGISVLLGLLTIFLYKRRILQIRIAALNIGLLIGLAGMIYFFAKTGSRELSSEYAFHFPIVLPLVAVVLTVLAIKAIGRDEALIRSMDRIR